MTAQSPRIGIIGTGAIGGFYGLMLARPTATGTPTAGKHNQRNTWQSQQLLVNIQVGQFQFLHYTAAAAVNWTVLGVRVHGSFFTSS